MLPLHLAAPVFVRIINKTPAAAACTRLLKDGKRQAQLVALNNRVEQAYGGKVDGRNAPHKDPGGFLEGALLNKDLTAAHDKFMADVEVRALEKANVRYCLRAVPIAPGFIRFFFVDGVSAEDLLVRSTLGDLLTAPRFGV